MSPRRRAAALLAATLLWAPCLLAFVDGPLPGMTGGFGEPSCQAGTLTALDQKAWIVAAGEPPVEYAQHSAAGTRARAGLLTWDLAWTAPGAAHPVLLHVAANAANDDASPLGDRVVLRSYGSAPSKPSPDG